MKISSFREVSLMTQLSYSMAFYLPILKTIPTHPKITQQNLSLESPWRIVHQILETNRWQSKALHTSMHSVEMLHQRMTPETR